MTRPVDDGLVRQRARRVAAQVAVLVGAAMLIIVGLATVLVVRGQQASTDRLLSATAHNADDVGDPPAGAWIIFRDRAGTTASPGLPAALAGRLPSTSGSRTVSADGGHYRVYTVQRGLLTVQVVYNLAPDRAQRDRMLRVMGAAAGVSLLVAAALGVLIGRRAVRPLAEALALQRTFVADASHELRTPVTLLSTRVQVLERGLPPDLPDQLRDDLSGIRADVQRLGGVIEDLLVAATPDLHEHRTSVDLREIVHDVVTSARAHADTRGVTLDVEDDGEARATVAEPAVRRAVLSLVDNAVDHTPSGGSVTVATRHSRQHVTVTVADTGPGLSEDAARQVFERFHSGGHRAGRAHYGLGLALTNDVALRHGGELSVQPSAAGAVFQLKLPR